MGEITPVYIELKKKVEAQRKVIARKRKLLNVQVDIVNKMLEDCTHEELEVVESYYDGDYYNKAHTDRWNKCKLCGKTSDKTTEMHSYYG